VADTSHDPASVAQEANAQAVKLLQRLLRGRALQNTLSMGLANRRELVAELRTQAPPGLALAYRHTVSRVCGCVCVCVYNIEEVSGSKSYYCAFLFMFCVHAVIVPWFRILPWAV